MEFYIRMRRKSYEKRTGKSNAQKRRFRAKAALAQASSATQRSTVPSIQNRERRETEREVETRTEKDREGEHPINIDFHCMASGYHYP